MYGRMLKSFVHILHWVIGYHLMTKLYFAKYRIRRNIDESIIWREYYLAKRIEKHLGRINIGE